MQRISIVVVILASFSIAAVCSAQLKKAEPSEFSKARAAHKTKLRTQGPSPQQSQDEAAPKGAEEITYKSGDLKLKAWITTDPGDGQKHPAVVYVHGGFAFGHDDFDETQPYRDAGLVVMTPMLRGENGNPGNFEFFYGEIDDVTAAGKHLGSLHYVDPKHIYVAGHSSGATETILAALVDHTPFEAAAPIGGYVSTIFFAKSPQWHDMLPFDPDDVAEVKLRSAIEYVSSIQRPITFYVGTEDRAAQLGLDLFLKAAKDAGKTCEKVELAGDHHASKPEAIKQSAAMFLKLSKQNR